MCRNNGVIHGVTIGTHYTGRARQILTLTTTGQLIPFNDKDIMLCVPDFVDKPLVEACGVDKLHTTEAELAARTRVLKKLRTIEKQIERAIHYVDNRASGLYDYLKSPNPHQWKRVDLQSAARFYARPGNTENPLAMKIAVHKHLMDHPRKFVAHPTAYRETQVFLVRPSAQVQNIADVTNWVRVDRGRVLNEFCDKVKAVMEQAKALCQQSASTTPHEIRTNCDYTLTDTDREILRFLLDAFHTRRLTQFNPYSIPTSYILKRLGEPDCTEWPVNQLRALQNILTDLGVFTPWIDGASFASRIESLAHRPVIKPLRAPPYPPKPLGQEDLYANDPLEALRHDFGDMPVYVIDDANASELDDGVSVESIPSEPENYWIHVHVADPTTLLPPTHTLAYKARAMSESSYLVHGTRYMLPPPMFDRFSLGHTAAAGQPQPVMTFSFKVDTAGDIVDYKVRAALIKNVHITTYDAVDAILGLPPSAPALPFEYPDLPPPSYSPMDPAHAERLKLLYQVSSRITKNRSRLPVFSYAAPSSQVRFTQPTLPPLPSPYAETDISTMLQFKLYHGFPDMSYSVIPPHILVRGARGMIAEFMQGAGRVASRFGVETGTPLVRRHGSEPAGPDPVAIEKLIASRDEFGVVDFYECAKAMIVMPRTVNTLVPRRHWGMGIPDGEGYVRVTSPLRRYADLVAHWQIKHTLLANSDPARYTKGKRVIFGEDWLAQYARELTFRDQEGRRAATTGRDYWSSLFLRRWLDGEVKSETLDPKTAVFEARPGVMKVKDDYLGEERFRSMVSQLGVWGDISSDKPLEIGSRVNVRIADVTMGARPKIRLEPV